MITTNLVSPTHSGAATLKEHTLGPFTGFTLSTMIKQSRIHHWIMFFVWLKIRFKYMCHQLRYSQQKKPFNCEQCPDIKTTFISIHAYPVDPKVPPPKDVARSRLIPAPLTTLLRKISEVEIYWCCSCSLLVPFFKGILSSKRIYTPS